MRVTDLFESPISDFTTLGDWDRNSSFRHETDRKLITNPKFVEHVKKKWTRTKEDFNLYFVNSPEAKRYTENGEVSQKWLNIKMPITSKEVEIKSNAIKK